MIPARRVVSALLGFALVGMTLAAEAQEPWVAANKGRIGVITGGVSGTYVRIGADLSAVLDGYSDLRVITMLGKGSVQNISDLLYLQGVDVAVVQSDVLTWLRERSPDSPALEKIAYVTKLYNEEVHILAHKELTSVADLAGKKVNVGVEGSGTNLTASLLFPFLGIDIYRENKDDRTALTALKAGQIDALMFVAGKPTPMILDDADIEDKLHLVAIPMTEGLDDIYEAATFDPSDYPNLNMTAPVETVAVSAVMAVYDQFAQDNPRYQRLVRFTQGLYGHLEDFRKPPRHPKWHEIDFKAEVPGWKRYAPMQDLLEKRVEPAPSGNVASTNVFQN